MSFKFFDQGYTADDIKQMRKPTHDELMQEKLCKQAESEQVLNILRTIKASQTFWAEEEAKAWEKATKRRR